MQKYEKEVFCVCKEPRAKGEMIMPIIARFYGILIKMYFREHGVPHFHAIYGEFNGVYDIQSCEIIEGDLPSRADRMVREWTQRYQSELLEMWKTQQFIQLPGLE